MRRLLMSLGLAAVVGGSVLGAAATLQIGNTTLSAADAVVASCDTDTNNPVTWTTDWYAAGGFFRAGWVQIEGLADACAFGTPFGKIAVTGSGGSTLYTAVTGNANWLTDPKGGPFDVPDDNILYFDMRAANIPAALIEDLHIVLSTGDAP
jgi:hypothetical protein